MNKEIEMLVGQVKPQQKEFYYEVLETRDKEHICPECGEKCIGLYFLSPPWTWKALCGRGGHMVICPNCPKMVEFGLTIMN